MPEMFMNEGKAPVITVDGRTFERRAVKAHFVKRGESYIDIMRTCLLPIYQEGDMIAISEKIAALCQNRVVERKDLPISFWARFLSRFASHPDTGVGVGETIKMQYAIQKVGLPKVLGASVASGATKLFVRHGVFYEIVGPEVAGSMTMHGASTAISASSFPRIPQASATSSQTSLASAP